MKVRGHGNGKLNHRTWNISLDTHPEYFNCDHDFVPTKLRGLLMCKHCTMLKEAE